MVAAGTITVAGQPGPLSLSARAAHGKLTPQPSPRAPPTAWESARLPQPTYDACIRGDGALSTPSGRSAATTAPLRDIVQIVDDRVLTFDPQEKDQTRAFVERGFMPPGTKRYKDRRFIFDRVLTHAARQQDVYESTAKPLLRNLLDGFNATIFAYGATGCGKTHTISGDRGPQGGPQRRCRRDVPRNIQRGDPGPPRGARTPTPRGGLQIREDKAVKVVGLAELRPTSADEVKQIVLLGNSRRTQSPTHANETSSRSHAVLQVHVTQSPRTASLTEQRTMATLSIIDLAGSERAAATTNMGQRMVEGANINKSLLALGNCINALCESGGAIRHVPYRNSKLTRLLKFSLGGNCKTVMIVCVAPTSAHFDDTHNTLVYAERATKIKTKVVTRNVVNVDRHVGQYVEAINRLNLEVRELKEKLAGKRDVEAEKERRRKKEAAQEIEKAKSDLQLKAEQTYTIDPTLDAQAASSPLSPDLEAERGLLQALAGPEEQVLKTDSALNVRVQKAGNSGAMFEATLRAVSERRSDKLDDVSVENVKLDARWHKADMERVKAEAGQEALKDAVANQAETVMSLVGMVSRCTVMLNEASRALRSSTEEGRDSIEATAKALASSLKNVADSNDEAFKALLGHSIADYAVSPRPQGTSLHSFKGYPSSLGIGRVTSGPVVSQQTKANVSRRSSSYGSSVGGSPLRKSHKSPRKSLRSSMAPAPYRRVSDKAPGKKKGVQWKDLAGQGDIDDAGTTSTPEVVISITPADSGSSISSLPSVPSLRRNISIGGSESEWEDEKTEDSVNLSFASSSAPTSSAIRTHGKRPRASRLDPTFLKSRSRGSVLGSLAEDDEDAAASQGSPRRASPLSDRNMNRAPSPAEGSSSGSDTLHVPKGRDRHHNSPSKRMPMSSKTGGGIAAKSNRRRSNIGPQRSERPRRRSSMIPQLSPRSSEANDSGSGSQALSKSVNGGPRRVQIGERSPAKRPKRMSLLAVSSARLNGSMRFKAFDPNASMEVSFRSAGGSRPLWK
ncbi:Kinesin-like protein 6 [Grifola frondosa]|uniref:Kinesin-like protein 6 n=1 Tax=Grifola frondosa TaxID=5627 RepID=A0A1C7MJ47_GRIFR|nr:Kinesin-like protein 6 [Grifola frondosa]